MDIEKYIINYSLKQNDYKQSFLRFSEERSFLYNKNVDVENTSEYNKTTDWQVSKNLIIQRGIYNEV